MSLRDRHAVLARTLSADYSNQAKAAALVERFGASCDPGPSSRLREERTQPVACDGTLALMDNAASKRIRQHARSPLHWGHLGSPDAELTRTLGHDELTLQLKIQNDAIADVAFSGDACGLSRAAASIASDNVIGMGVSQIAALDRAYVLNLLAVELAEPRKQCAFLCADLLQAAAQQHLDG